MAPVGSRLPRVGNVCRPVRFWRSGTHGRVRGRMIRTIGLKVPYLKRVAAAAFARGDLLECLHQYFPEVQRQYQV